MSWTVPRIYTLGNSPLLNHITQELARHPAQPAVPELVKLLANETEFTQFRNANSTLQENILNAKRQKSTRSIQLMSAFQPPVYGNGDVVHVKNLVIDYEYRKMGGMLRYKKCLDKSSNIVVLNGDKAAMDHLVANVFNDVQENERPNLYQCLTDFRVWKGEEKFKNNFIGFGSMRIGRIPRSYENHDLELDVQNVDILKVISECTGLNAKFLNYQHFNNLQYEHLIIKSSISTFSALFDCSNGELLKMNITAPLRKYVNECVKIILASDPSLDPNLNSLTAGILDVDRLLSVIYEVLRSTEKQSSMMRKQFQAFNDVDLFNNTGYFCKLARTHHLKFSLYNSLYNQLLSARIDLKDHRDEDGKVTIFK